MRFLTLRAFSYSLLVHLFVSALLVFGYDRSSPVVQLKPEPQEDIIAATAVDNQAVEQELQRLKEIDQQKAREQEQLEKRVKELQEQTRQAAAQREKEQKRLAELKKQDVQLAKKRAEEERIWKEKEAKKREQERMEKEKEAKRREQERIRKEKETAELKRKREQEARQRQQAAEQQRKDRQLKAGIIGNISRQVNVNFNKTGLPAGLECVLSVQTVPGGEVVSVSISKSSGNEVFDRRARTAVDKSSPLPIPADPKIHNRLKLRNFYFRFKPKE